MNFRPYFKKTYLLKDLNLEMMTFVCSKIGISTVFNLSESYIDNSDYVDKRMYNFDHIELRDTCKFLKINSALFLISVY